VHGNPAGTVYFDRGQIAFARASWIPDLSARLLGALAPTAQSRDLLIDGDRPDRDICTLLLQQEDLTRAELQKILRSVVVDAVLVLTIPMDQDSFVAGIRFVPGRPALGECLFPAAGGLGTGRSRPQSRPPCSSLAGPYRARSAA